MRWRRKDETSEQSAKASGNSLITQVAGNQQIIHNYDGRPSPGEAGALFERLRPIAELNNPFDLEVHRAVEVADSDLKQLDILPTYVPRKHDSELADVVARAAGGQSTIAILVADSSAGKTRACWEAVCASGVLADWVLWHPITPDRPQALLTGLPQVGPRTVLWLNESQHYLLTEGSTLGEQVAAGLRDLLRDEARSPVLIVGTLWTSFSGTLTAEPDPGVVDSHAQARALLVGTEIWVPEQFTEAEIDAVRAAASNDPRLSLALEHSTAGRIAQFLAGAPELERRYRQAGPGPRALIQVAMDVQRLSQGSALTAALLEAASPGYLTDQEWDELPAEWLEKALAYCNMKCRGARGALTHIRPRPGQPAPQNTVYRLADHLELLGRNERRLDPIPASLCDALVSHAEASDLATLGQAAEARGLYHSAVRLYSAANSASTLLAAGYLLERAGRDEEALNFYQRTIDTNIVDSVRAGFHALLAAVRILERAGRIDEAVTLLVPRANIASRDDLIRSEGHGLVMAARVLARAGRIDDALKYCRDAAVADDSIAATVALQLLSTSTRVDEAVSFYCETVNSRDPLATVAMARALEKAGRIDESHELYRGISADGRELYLPTLELILERNQRALEAASWLQCRSRVGDSHARKAIDAVMRGEDKEELGHSRSAYEVRDRDTLLAKAIRAVDNSDDVDEVLASYYGHGSDELIRFSSDAPIIDLFETRAKAAMALRKIENGDLVVNIADNSSGTALANSQEQRETLEGFKGYLRGIEQGATPALLTTARYLAGGGRIDAAMRYCNCVMNSGDAMGFRETVNILESTGHSEMAAQLNLYGRGPDDTIAEPWSITDLPPTIRPSI